MRSGDVAHAIQSLQVEAWWHIQMTKVKICGLKETEHVKAAVEAGADAIGFVFAPSKREVTIEQARELAKEFHLEF